MMLEVDTERGGLITLQDFLMWPGKQAVLEWLDSYHERVLARFGGTKVTGSPVRLQRYPWEGIGGADLLRVFRSEAWAGTVVLSEFQRVLDKLGLDGGALGRPLFEAFDQDENGHLDFREIFIGMALLLKGMRTLNYLNPDLDANPERQIASCGQCGAS